MPFRIPQITSKDIRIAVPVGSNQSGWKEKKSEARKLLEIPKSSGLWVFFFGCSGTVDMGDIKLGKYFERLFKQGWLDSSPVAP